MNNWNWKNANEIKPLHSDLVLAAMWRPDTEDYGYWIATYECGKWIEWGDPIELDLEKNCGYKIVYWCDIVEPPITHTSIQKITAEIGYG